jgi:integrative and conjugative element protein (TIGR02256 family)
MRRPSKQLGIAWIVKTVLQTMVDEARRRAPNETGGVLLGYWADAGTQVVITDAVGPGPKAVHKRASFEPDHAFQEAEIGRLYRRSGRRLSYLGDWHTHPRGGLGLSRKDRRTLGLIASDPAARAPTPLIAILAGRRRWHIAFWRGALASVVSKERTALRLIVAPLRLKAFD